MFKTREASCSGAKFAGQWSRIGCRTTGVKYLMKPAPDFPPPVPAPAGGRKQHQNGQGQRQRELASTSSFRGLANDLRSWSKQILANRADDDDGELLLNHLDDSERGPECVSGQCAASARPLE